ncbi:MAG: dTMP kinase [Euryarchaeota archaeon]|nr:dTMP kinase [Euryarchaeota archaeon]
MEGANFTTMLLLAFEGIDGSGKGTQAKLLARWLRERGYEVFLTREPTGGAIGRVLRRGLSTSCFLPRTEALLFAADRSEHLREIMEHLHEGRIVVTERYFYSSLAYQSAAGLELEWLRSINSFAPEADLVIYLDVDPEVALERITSPGSLRGVTREREHFERREFLERVREAYLELAREYDNFEVVPAEGSIEEVQTAVRRRVSARLAAFERERKTGEQRALEDFLARR